jgi:tripartite-type tricarboxylate transporter receptor subunit TctC
MSILRTLLPLALCVAIAPLPAAAQYPERAVRLVVPFPAGGPSDSAARIVGQALARSLGQPVVVENKPGADGGIAAQSVAAAYADGYTLLWATSAVLALPLVAKPAPFDTYADFAPVSSVGRFAFGMYVHPGVPSQSLADFIAFARANPGKLNYASANMAEHLAAAQFMKATGVEMVRVPYKGSAQLMPDLIAGRVQVNFGPVGGALAHVKDGRIRMLATLLPERTQVTPEVPTMAEGGFPGVSVWSYQMILAPARTPRRIVERLAREINAALDDEDVRARFASLALVVDGSSPERLAAMMRMADRDWAQFFREAGLASQ